MVSSLTRVGHFCFPPAEDPAECANEEKAKTLKERITENWREIPALVAVAVCIIGLILSIGWNYTHLSIVFGTGSGCSIYSYFFISSQMHNLKSMKGYLGDFHEENEGLKTEVGNFQTENVQLTTTSAALHSEAETFKTANITLTSTNLSLTGTVEQLQKLNTALHSFYKTFATEGARSQEEFRTGLKRFDEELVVLGKEHSSAAQTASLLAEVLTRVSEDFSYEKTQKMWEDYAVLQREMGQLDQQRIDFQQWIDEFKPVVQGLVSTLHAENERLTANNERLTANTDRVGGNAETLQLSIQQVSALTQHFLGGSQTPFPVQPGYAQVVY